MFKKIMLIVCCLALFVGMLSCGADGDYSYDGYKSEDITDGSGDSTGENDLIIQDTTRKIYYTTDLEINSKDVSSDAKAMNALIEGYNGYIQSCQSAANDNGTLYKAYYVYRIPTDKLNDFLSKVDAGFVVTKKVIDTEDITNTYNQTEAKIETLQTARASYVQMLSTATTTDDIIKLQDKIAEIDAQLATYTKNKNTYDELLNYCTIEVSISNDDERNVSAEPNFFDEYGEYLVGLVTFLFEAFMYLLPFIVVAGIVLAIIFVPKAVKNKKNKKQEPEQKNEF